jgi:hypothetical protein
VLSESRAAIFAMPGGDVALLWFSWPNESRSPTLKRIENGDPQLLPELVAMSRLWRRKPANATKTAA